MSALCLQALDSGEPCNAPALNGSSFCRHHDPQRLAQNPKSISREREPFALPPFQDKAGILAAITEVLHAMADRRIKRSEADTFIHGLKYAGRLIAELEEAGTPVSSARFQPMQPGPSFSAAGVYEPSLLDLDEFKETLQTGSPLQLRDQIIAKQTAWARNRSETPSLPPVISRPAERAVPHLAASRDPRKARGSFSTDRFVEQLIAKSHEQSARSAKPDARFTRA